MLIFYTILLIIFFVIPFVLFLKSSSFLPKKFLKYISLYIFYFIYHFLWYMIFVIGAGLFFIIIWSNLMTHYWWETYMPWSDDRVGIIFVLTFLLGTLVIIPICIVKSHIEAKKMFLWSNFKTKYKKC